MKYGCRIHIRVEAIPLLIIYAKNRKTLRNFFLTLLLLGFFVCGDMCLADDSQESTIDGKEVIVRAYRNWKDYPETFEKMSVTIKDERCTLAATSNVFAVVGEDQVYESIRKLIGNRIYTAYGKLDLWIPNRAPEPQKESQWFFEDAFGKIIPNATVEIFLYDYQGPRIKIGKFLTDGTLKKLSPQNGLDTFEFIISNPKYGIAIARGCSDERSHITIPLVDVNSEAATSAIWGFILDPDNNPVEGAEIQCNEVRTLGEGLITPKSDVIRYAALSDQRGFFNMYITVSEQFQEQRGVLIPLKSKYHVKINAPKHLELLPYNAPLENGKELKIILERPAGKKHTLIFKDEQGVITDPNKLKQIVLCIQQEDKAPLTLGYNDFKELKAFPLAKYTAQMTSSPLSPKFEPIEVTENSPQELVFKLSDAVTYFGQIVHGITGVPIPGASVRLVGRPGKNLWLTNGDGRFEIKIGQQESFSEFTFSQENYIPVIRPNLYLKPAVNNCVEIETINLFPAANVIIEPCVDENDIAICPRWIANQADNPDWAKLLKSGYGSFLKPNQANTFQVPAQMHLRVSLEMPYAPQWCPIVFEQAIYLQQGQTLDLGKCTFKPALQISAQVVNSAGEPVEGVPVMVVVGGQGTVAHNADANGIVRFFVPPNSKGEFVIIAVDENQHRELLRETKHFKIGDESRQFTVKISDKMLDLLFK